MMNIKKVFISFIIVFVFFTVNIQSSLALTKAIFPTLNPPQPKPANLRPNISKGINEPKDDFIYLNREGNYVAPNDTNNGTVNGNTLSLPNPETKNKNVSPILLVVIILIVSILLFFLNKKLKNRGSSY